MNIGVERSGILSTAQICLGELIIVLRVLVATLTDLSLQVELMTFSICEKGRDEEASVGSLLAMFRGLSMDKKHLPNSTDVSR